MGNFIMYPKATDGNEPNNYLFSSCSKHDMSSIISFRGPQCFIGELSKSRKTRREIKLKISLAFEMLGLNLQSFVLEGIFFLFRLSRMHISSSKNVTSSFCQNILSTVCH